jgi:hypothetical protein
MQVHLELGAQCTRCIWDSDKKVDSDFLDAVTTGESAEEPGATAVHPADSKSDQEEASQHRFAATLLPSGLSSTPATPNFLATKPSV